MSVAEPAPGSVPLPVRRLGALSGPVIGLVVVLGIFIILIGLRGELGQFLSLDNLQVLVQEATIPAVVALGALLVIISGGIDLSVGSVLALVSVVTMQVYNTLHQQLGPDSVLEASLLAVGAGVAVGGACGLVNGLIITQLRVAPFVATLGMLSIARGLAVWLAGRQLRAFKGGQPEWVSTLQRVRPEPAWSLFNPGFWSLALLAGLVAVLLRYMVLGRHIYAVGSNEGTARLCGVSINRTKIFIYTLAGLLAGWGGILMFAHGASGDPSGGVGLELDVIAAVVIGGASLNGGQGTVLGTLLGILILGVLGNGVSIFNVPIEVQYILIGVIIIANTALSQWQRHRAE